ncbi:MAG: ABC transporter ATP-binding protein [Endomicrobiales bacterium]|nr:ABC transporter ATP-binding protein [Endomicrobiales bacterium]
MIKTGNLTKKFGKLIAVDNISIEVAQGEVFAFLGPNGAGKTTMVKLLTGLLLPTSGSIAIAGYDIAKEPLKAKAVSGYVSDQPFVYPYLTGFEFMRFVGDIYGVSPEMQRTRIPELLEMFELTGWQDALIESYSHGMKQKLVIASVLLHKPRILFLDEPLVGLDPKSARLVKDVFRALSKRGTTIFMCTHVLEIAERLCDRVCIIDKGRIVAMESVEGLKKLHASRGNLEEVFLEITGGTEYSEMLKYL